MECRYELSSPEQLEAAREACPIILVPMGSLEHHGRHLPVGYDGLKAHALCCRVAERIKGGSVMPPFYFGAGGAHANFPWSMLYDENAIGSILRRTLKRAAANNYRAALIVSGHYPSEQFNMIKRIAEEVMTARPGFVVLAYAEHEADPYRESADHAAYWETAILMELLPECVHLERLETTLDGTELPPTRYATMDPERIPGICDDPSDPLFGIYGMDPRQATPEIGREVVETMVKNLAEWAKEAVEKAG